MIPQTLSLGVLIGVPILAIVLLAFLVFTVFAFHEGELGLFFSGIACFVVVLALALSPLGFYPYSGEYHSWSDHGGKVAKVDKRLISKGKSMEDKFVVRFAGSGQQYACDDTRCAQAEVGDHLTLSCKRAWQYTGTDGYDCRFVSLEERS